MNQTFKTQPAADQPVTFNETLGGSQVLFGGFSDLLGGSTFLPVAHDATGLGLSVQGSIDQPGDTVDVTFRSQFGTLRGHATYEGYYSVGSEQVFVFHPSFEFPGLGSAFAITRDGQAVPGAHDPIPLDTGTADTCFLRGTMIGTARGAVAVEDLVAGDEVSVMEHGRAVSRPVSWIGRQHRSIDSRHATPDAYPVRIRAGAFREEVPHRDLLVTAEHCVFVDGVLIPARMLVNGRSIVVDRSITAFDYFHLELERHGILVAEGLETESYLDTGNRGTFANGAGANGAASIDTRTWAEHAAAPLTVDRAAVEPVWNRLAARAEALGMASAPELALMEEPVLRLVTRSGMEIAPTLVDGRSYAFVVPGGVDAVRLRSRSSRPSEIVGPFLDDRRRLGVLVGQISVGAGRRRHDYDAHLTADTLSGWHPREDDAPRRWTNGDASLVLDLAETGNRPVFLDIEVLAAGPYRGDGGRPAA